MAGQLPQLGWTMDDLGNASIAFACATGYAIYGALKTGGYKPVLVGASVVTMANLATGVYVSTTGRRRRTLAFFNFCACFVPLVIAMLHGGEFKVELSKNIFQALQALRALAH